MENGPFIDDFPIKTSIYEGFSMAMLNNQRVLRVLVYQHLSEIFTHPGVNKSKRVPVRQTCQSTWKVSRVRRMHCRWGLHCLGMWKNWLGRVKQEELIDFFFLMYVYIYIYINLYTCLYISTFFSIQLIDWLIVIDGWINITDDIRIRLIDLADFTDFIVCLTSLNTQITVIII